MSFKTLDGRMEIVICGRCEFQLMMMDGGGEVTIRIRDQYIYAKGGYLRVICRGCGTPNVLIDSDYEVECPEDVKQLRQLPGTIQASVRQWYGRKKETQNKGV